MGYGSDMMGRCTPWILGGMTLLAFGGVMAATATALMAWSVLWGGLLAMLAFSLIGLGVSASGTSVLVLLAKRVEDHRRAAAATIVWLMMISGLAVTASVTRGCSRRDYEFASPTIVRDSREKTRFPRSAKTGLARA